MNLQVTQQSHTLLLAAVFLVVVLLISVVMTTLHKTPTQASISAHGGSADSTISYNNHNKSSSGHAAAGDNVFDRIQHNDYNEFIDKKLEAEFMTYHTVHHTSVDCDARIGTRRWCCVCLL